MSETKNGDITMIDSPQKLARSASLFANNRRMTKNLIKNDKFPIAAVSFHMEGLTGKDYDFLLKYTSKQNAQYIFNKIQEFPTTWLLTNKYSINFRSLGTSYEDKFMKEIGNWYLPWTVIPIKSMKPFKNLAERPISGLLEDSAYLRYSNGHIHVPISKFSDDEKMKLDVSLLEQKVSLYLPDKGLNFHPKLYQNILEP